MSAPYSGQPRASTGLIVAGYILAIIIPIVGLILGIVAITKGSKGAGWGIVILSVVIIVIGIAITAGG